MQPQQIPLRYSTIGSGGIQLGNMFLLLAVVGRLWQLNRVSIISGEDHGA